MLSFIISQGEYQAALDILDTQVSQIFPFPPALDFLQNKDQYREWSVHTFIHIMCRGVLCLTVPDMISHNVASHSDTITFHIWLYILKSYQFLTLCHTCFHDAALHYFSIQGWILNRIVLWVCMLSHMCDIVLIV